MSAKTKIVVLHMKELIYTGIFAVLGILLVILLVMMFLPDKKGPTDNKPPESSMENGADPSAAPASRYIPGIYTTQLVLGGQMVDLEVIVDKTSISSIQLVNLSETVTTMYPLLEPTLDSICKQIYETQSLDEISYTTDSRYTSMVLLEAIQNSLDKAAVKDSVSSSDATGSPTAPSK